MKMSHKLCWGRWIIYLRTPSRVRKSDMIADPTSSPMMGPADIIAQSTPPRAPNLPSEKSSKSAGPTFSAPENFAPPADAVPGQEFQALGTFTLTEDGQMTLVAVDGAAVGSKEPDAAAAIEPVEGEPAAQ